MAVPARRHVADGARLGSGFGGEGQLLDHRQDAEATEKGPSWIEEGRLR